eukprot:8822354-Pyramimonas_sp.AAC.1
MNRSMREEEMEVEGRWGSTELCINASINHARTRGEARFDSRGERCISPPPQSSWQYLPLLPLLSPSSPTFAASAFAPCLPRSLRPPSP